MMLVPRLDRGRPFWAGHGLRAGPGHAQPAVFGGRAGYRGQAAGEAVCRQAGAGRDRSGGRPGTVYGLLGPNGAGKPAPAIRVLLSVLPVALM